MIEVYRVKKQYAFNFCKVLAEKVTKKTVVVQGVRQDKRSSYSCYFEDFNEAKDHAVLHLLNKKEELLEQLKLVEENIEQVSCLTEDKIAVSSGVYA